MRELFMLDYFIDFENKQKITDMCQPAWWDCCQLIYRRQIRFRLLNVSKFYIIVALKKQQTEWWK